MVAADERWPTVMTELRTGRLLLRQWREADVPDYTALNADPEVRRWFPGTLIPDENARQLAVLRERIEVHGFGCWAVEVPGMSRSSASWVSSTAVRRDLPRTTGMQLHHDGIPRCVARCLPYCPVRPRRLGTRPQTQIGKFAANERWLAMAVNGPLIVSHRDPYRFPE